MGYFIHPKHNANTVRSVNYPRTDFYAEQHVCLERVTAKAISVSIIGDFIVNEEAIP